MRLIADEELEETIKQKAISAVMSALNSEDLKIWKLTNFILTTSEN